MKKQIALMVITILANILLPGASGSTEARRIEIVAKKFAFTPDEITVKKGEPVVLVLRSDDVAHGIKFKELRLQADVPKGKTVELPFTPETVGTFEGKCSHFCGAGHGRMKLLLKVTE